DVSMMLKDQIFTELRVCLPGQVTSVNTDGTINVQPAVMHTAIDMTSFSYAPLFNVPFVTIQGGGVALSLPPAIGDNCLVIFSDRSLDSWKVNQGNPAPLPSFRTHDISDGFAIVGLNPTPTLLAPVVPGSGDSG